MFYTSSLKHFSFSEPRNIRPSPLQNKIFAQRRHFSWHFFSFRRPKKKLLAKFKWQFFFGLWLSRNPKIFGSKLSLAHLVPTLWTEETEVLWSLIVSLNDTVRTWGSCMQNTSSSAGRSGSPHYTRPCSVWKEMLYITKTCCVKTSQACDKSVPFSLGLQARQTIEQPSKWTSVSRMRRKHRDMSS